MRRVAGTALLLALASIAACRPADGNNAAVEAGNAAQIARACTPRRPSWMAPSPFMGVIVNSISLDQDGVIYWNGVRSNLTQVSNYLSVIARMNPMPMTFLKAEMGVPCALVERVRDVMEQRLDCRHNGPCAEGIPEVWLHTPIPPGTPPS